MKQKPQPPQWFVFCLSLLPACLLALLIFKYSVDLPQWDQWAYVTFFEKLSRASLTFGDLFAQVNEYRQFFPNLVFVVLGWLTHWDVRYEMVVTFLTACLISLNVYVLAKRTISDDRTSRLFLFLLANLIIFSPNQYQNWLQGQQLVYYFPIACVTSCLLIAGSGWKVWTKFGVCAVLAAVSTFSSANGILCWLVVLPSLVLPDSSNRPATRRLITGWAIGFFASAALYVYHYHKPWWSPSPATALSHPLRAIAYFFGFLGAPLALEKGKAACVIGFILICAFGLSNAYLIKSRGNPLLVRRLIVWLMIGWYSVLTAVMTTIGRLGFGVGQSQNTRYIGFSAYLIVALIFVVRIITQDLSSRNEFAISAIRIRRVALLAAVALLLAQPFIYFLSINRMAEMKTTLLQAKAMVLFINLKPDPTLIGTLYPDLNYLAEEANELNRLGFLRPELIKTLRVLEFAQSSSNLGNYGSWRLTRTTNDQLVATGQATLPYRGDGADAIILAYQTNSREILMFRITRPQEISAGFWHGPVRSGEWQVSFAAAELPTQPVTLTAWAFDANSGRAFQLNGSFAIPESNSVRKK
ncbi:MAG: hypothetical protein QOG23_3485 [Blastocatellia bacterium]|jgi:hypothetical protein|nr:hypothetical protein [Blastocatellia bacterium]